MNTANKTLWLGNIESWMDSDFLKETLKELGIFPTKITLKTKVSKRGCAFLEFDSHETALNVLNKYNGIIYKKINIKLNWVKKTDRLNIIKPVKFTVKYNI
jgi:RNA recognition motif-containing protein